MTLSGTPGCNRAQNEPLAVLIAVSLFIGGLLLFAGYHQGVVAIESDPAVGEPTLDRVYADLTDDDQYDLENDFEANISQEALPNGYFVTVTLTSISTESGQREQLEQAFFSPEGAPLTDTDERADLVQRLEADETAGSASRPIMIRDGDDDRGARLHVSFWRD